MNQMEKVKLLQYLGIFVSIELMDPCVKGFVRKGSDILSCFSSFYHHLWPGKPGVKWIMDITKIEWM